MVNKQNIFTGYDGKKFGFHSYIKFTQKYGEVRKGSVWLITYVGDDYIVVSAIKKVEGKEKFIQISMPITDVEEFLQKR